MITAEQIPDEVVSAANNVLWEMPWMRERHKGETRVAIATALNAWPKAFSDPVEGIGAHNRIVLPFPQKEPRT